ncbi:MAG: 50S ribosomal protein L21, partial [Pseudomonadota bacterium]
AKGAEKSGIAAATGTADARRTAHEVGVAKVEAPVAAAKPKRAAKAAAVAE